jgi:hypothetical protein
MLDNDTNLKRTLARFLPCDLKNTPAYITNWHNYQQWSLVETHNKEH